MASLSRTSENGVGGDRPGKNIRNLVLHPQFPVSAEYFLVVSSSFF